MQLSSFYVKLVCVLHKKVKLILIDKGLYFSSNAVSHPVIVASNLCCHNWNLTIKTQEMQYYKIVDYFVTNNIYYQVISNIWPRLNTAHMWSIGPKLSGGILMLFARIILPHRSLLPHSPLHGLNIAVYNLVSY